MRSLLFLAALFTGLLVAASPSPATPVVLGDSISDTHWVSTMWPAPAGYTAAGVAGDGVSQAYARLHPNGIYGGWDWPSGEIVPYSGTTFVLLGTNDILSDRDAQYIEGGLSAIYSYLHSKGSTPVAMTIPPFGWSAGFTTARQAVWAQVNTWILSQPRHVDLTPFLAGTTVPPTYQSGMASPDNVHPSVLGSQVIAYVAQIEVAVNAQAQRAAKARLRRAKRLAALRRKLRRVRPGGKV
jgi:hypothetical protein